MSLPVIADYASPRADELPAPRVPWRADPSRAVLLVHDVQQYFLQPFGETHAALATMIANITRIRVRCHALGVPVVYTAQHGNQDQVERGLQRDFWGRGMPDDGVAPRIVDALAPTPGDRVLPKWRYSAFQRNPLDTDLRALGRDQLVVTGVYAHIGCFLTAADAFMRDIEPFFVADAVADFSRERHDQALDHAARCFARVLTTDQLLEAW